MTAPSARQSPWRGARAFSPWSRPLQPPKQPFLTCGGNLPPSASSCGSRLRATRARSPAYGRTWWPCRAARWVRSASSFTAMFRSSRATSRRSPTLWTPWVTASGQSCGVRSSAWPRSSSSSARRRSSARACKRPGAVSRGSAWRRWRARWRSFGGRAATGPSRRAPRWKRASGRWRSRAAISQPPPRRGPLQGLRTTRSSASSVWRWTGLRRSRTARSVTSPGWPRSCPSGRVCSRRRPPPLDSLSRRTSSGSSPRRFLRRYRAWTRSSRRSFLHMSALSRAPPKAASPRAGPLWRKPAGP
mmetsp:Transcript_47715/g.150020  ORF Transcript_47715/g.150020 Transcript_47715/m.150020 type:complete len:302 (+) Transcript_47715:583-1488(+)